MLLDVANLAGQRFLRTAVVMADINTPRGRAAHRRALCVAQNLPNKDV